MYCLEMCLEEIVAQFVGHAEVHVRHCPLHASLLDGLLEKPHALTDREVLVRAEVAPVFAVLPPLDGGVVHAANCRLRGKPVSKGVRAHFDHAAVEFPQVEAVENRPELEVLMLTLLGDATRLAFFAWRLIFDSRPTPAEEVVHHLLGHERGEHRVLCLAGHGPH